MDLEIHFAQTIREFEHIEQKRKIRDNLQMVSLFFLFFAILICFVIRLVNSDTKGDSIALKIIYSLVSILFMILIIVFSHNSYYPCATIDMKSLAEYEILHHTYHASDKELICRIQKNGLIEDIIIPIDSFEMRSDIDRDILSFEKNEIIYEQKYKF